MTDARKPKIENLEQEPRELTPEQAEQAQGGIIINGRTAAERGIIIDFKTLGGPDT